MAIQIAKSQVRGTEWVAACAPMRSAVDAAPGWAHATMAFPPEQGAHVTATCSQKAVELCRKLGADRVVDYKQER